MSIILISLSASLFQGAPIANAAVPGAINRNSPPPTISCSTYPYADITFGTPTGTITNFEYRIIITSNSSPTVAPATYPNAPTGSTYTRLSPAAIASPLRIPLPDTTYGNWRHLYIRALNSEGSAAGEATYIGGCSFGYPPLPNTPGQPTGVAGDGLVTVTIVPPTGGGTPTSYTVTASPQVGGVTRTCTVTSPATSCTVTGLTNGTAYTFTSTATNSGGTSSASIASTSATPTDTTAPTITSVSSSSSNGSYKLGSSIAVTVIFSEAIIVTGTPQLKLETGTTDQIVNYTSGSGTNTLTFNYVVQAGDVSSDLDYFSTSALTLNGGTIKDAAAFDAVLTLASPGSTGSIANAKEINVDTTVPTASLTAATVIGSGNATVQSSEAGTAYLVNSTVSVTSLASITGAADSLWNSVSVTASTNTNLSVSGLDLGE